MGEFLDNYGRIILTVILVLGFAAFCAASFIPQSKQALLNTIDTYFEQSGSLKSCLFDINSLIDGSPNYGGRDENSILYTYNLYVNGKLYRRNISDTCEEFLEGTILEIKNIKPRQGFQYITGGGTIKVDQKKVNPNTKKQSIYLQFESTK